jgi:hypothetical protein
MSLYGASESLHEALGAGREVGIASLIIEHVHDQPEVNGADNHIMATAHNAFLDRHVVNRMLITTATPQWQGNASL